MFNQIDLIQKICDGDFSLLYYLNYEYRLLFRKYSKYVVVNNLPKKTFAMNLLKSLNIYNGPIWDGKIIPLDNPKVNMLTLPNKEKLGDAVIWKDFLQDELKIDPQKLWQQLLSYPRWDKDTTIPFRPEGDDVHWITGEHSALKYRGNALKRSKIWSQNNYKKGLLKYGYTGWQHKISYATHDIKHIKPLNNLAKKINNHIPEKMNHWIVTYYNDGDDYIGFHSDKSKDFKENSYFIVIKLGTPRKFEFRMKETKTNPKPKPFFSEVLSAGTAIFVRANSNSLDANSIVQHGVPQTNKKIGNSGSIVARTIETVIPWEKVEKNIQKSIQDQKRRRLEKKKRLEKKN